jgi:hypothetical protein
MLNSLHCSLTGSTGFWGFTFEFLPPFPEGRNNTENPVYPVWFVVLLFSLETVKPFQFSPRMVGGDCFR